MASSSKTPADYVAAFLAPLLVVTLAGSLVWFLADVLYGGRYPQWVLLIFAGLVVGAVAIARLSLRERGGFAAAAAAAALGGAAWLGLSAAMRLPRDSGAAEYAWAVNLGLVLFILWTVYRLTVDSTHDDRSPANGGRGLLDAGGLEKKTADSKETTIDQDVPLRIRRKRRRTSDNPLADWWRRWRDYRRERRLRPRTHGVWVVYFSLAALPLFGLGQSFIPREDEARRRLAFVLMTVYVASGLGLLLTTTFLGLRSFLRSKNARMPASQAGVWLGFGSMIILAVLAVAALMPRPYPEYPPIEPLANFGLPRWKPKEKQAAKIGDSGTVINGSHEKKSRQSKKASAPAKKRSPQPTSPPAFVSWLWIVKWIALGAAVIAFLFLASRGLLRYLSHFTVWARVLQNWLATMWRSFWSPKEAAAEPDMPAPPPRPFAFYRDPYLSGTAGQMSAQELAQYSFAAVQAWARENDHAGPADETPLEFTERLSANAPNLKKELRRLMGVYSAAAYAPHLLPDDFDDELREFWLEWSAATSKRETMEHSAEGS